MLKWYTNGNNPMEANNKPFKKVTIERVRQTKTFENLTDEQAQEVIDTFKQIAYMTFDIFKTIPEHEQKKFIRDL